MFFSNQVFIFYFFKSRGQVYFFPIKGLSLYSILFHSRGLDVVLFQSRDLDFTFPIQGFIYYFFQIKGVMFFSNQGVYGLFQSRGLCFFSNQGVYVFFQSRGLCFFPIKRFRFFLKIQLRGLYSIFPLNVCVRFKYDISASEKWYLRLHTLFLTYCARHACISSQVSHLSSCKDPEEPLRVSTPFWDPFWAFFSTLFWTS